MARNIGNSSLTDEQRKLVEDNVGLVYAEAHRRGVTSEDLIQEGMIGLMNAARYYSPEFGVKFSTYAGSYIWAALFGTYSDKKQMKNAALTDSLDDPNKNIQLPSYGVGGCFGLDSNCDPLANEIIRFICEGYTKKEIRELLNISVSKINSILDKIGRDLYEERYIQKAGK